MDSSATPLFFVLFFILVIVGITISLTRPRSILVQWASEYHYQIISAERCIFFRGPFFFRSSKHQVVYYVTIRDTSGAQRSGYVRCGGWMLGLLSNEVVVRWDD